MGSMIPKEIKYKLYYVEVRGMFYRRQLSSVNLKPTTTQGHRVICTDSQRQLKKKKENK